MLTVTLYVTPKLDFLNPSWLIWWPFITEAYPTLYDILILKCMVGVCVFNRFGLAAERLQSLALGKQLVKQETEYSSVYSTSPRRIKLK